MYSVAGTQNYVADGLVPVSSVEAGKYIYQGTAKSYTQITVTGNWLNIRRCHKTVK